MHRIALKGVIFRATLLMERGGAPGMAAMTGAMGFLPRRRCEGLELVAMAGCRGGGGHPTRSIFSSAITIAIATVCIARHGYGWTVCLVLSVRASSSARLFVCSLVTEWPVSHLSCPNFGLGRGPHHTWPLTLTIIFLTLTHLTRIMSGPSANSSLRTNLALLFNHLHTHCPPPVLFVQRGAC